MTSPTDPGHDLTRTLAFLHERLTRRPRLLMILGSGLGALADELEDAVAIPFADVPGFAPATVAGHSGRLLAGRLEGLECVVLQGRPHAYEGLAADALVVPVRAVAALGARTMLVTNAAGGINRLYRPGEPMLLDDHINLMGRNPLTGPAVAGEHRHPEMGAPYDPALQRLAEEVAAGLGLSIRRGVYAAVSGPSYETRAEIRMLERLGADAVGMSTVPEVLTARALGLRVLGISLITNAAAGLSLGPLDHDEVVQAGREAQGRFSALVRGFVRRFGERLDTE